MNYKRLSQMIREKKRKLQNPEDAEVVTTNPAPMNANDVAHAEEEARLDESMGHEGEESEAPSMAEDDEIGLQGKEKTRMARLKKFISETF